MMYDESKEKQIHANMTSYFTGEWFGKPKPLSLYKGKKAEYQNCHRNVPPMPNDFGENVPNLRKLTELPYQLIKSSNINASADLLCDFDFLSHKLRYMGLKALLAD